MAMAFRMAKNKRNKFERKLDEYNHIMELIRTIIPIAILILQVVILLRLV
jgi:heme/copper-type cytochrome/quinol oxidase subunit 2|tara:strand:- start:555 stop:704 length:150 start_codon:yes stop_codon:yes gene_type:complete